MATIIHTNVFVLKEREKCCKDVCGYCYDEDYPVIEINESDIPEYMHQTPSGKLLHCDANLIRQRVVREGSQEG